MMGFFDSWGENGSGARGEPVTLPPEKAPLCLLGAVCVVFVSCLRVCSRWWRWLCVLCLVVFGWVACTGSVWLPCKQPDWFRLVGE